MLKAVVGTVKDEMKIMCALLQQHKKRLSRNSTANRGALVDPKPSSDRDGVLDASKDLLRLVSTKVCEVVYPHRYHAPWTIALLLAGMVLAISI